MFWSLFLSGIAMLLIAIMPPIGIIAILLIALLRFIQGLGLGGDGGSSLTLCFEYSNKSNKIGYFMSFPMAAAIIGILLGLVGIIVSENIESKLFLLSYGWRILIGVGALALIVSAYLRMRIVESFDFKELLKEGKTDPSPIKSIFKVYWKKILLLTLGMAYFPVILNFVLYPYSIELYSKLGFAEKQVVLLFLITSAIATAFTILGGYLSDKYDWKKIVLISAVGSAVGTFLLLLHSIIGLILLYLLSALGWGAMGLYPSEFNVKLRSTGSGIVFGLIGIFPAVLLIAVLPISIALYGIVGSLTPIISISEGITLVSIISIIVLMRRDERGLP